MSHRITVSLEFHDPTGQGLTFHVQMKYVPRRGDVIAFEASAISDIEMQVTGVREKFLIGTDSLIEVDAEEITGFGPTKAELIDILDRHPQVEIARGERPTA